MIKHKIQDIIVFFLARYLRRKGHSYPSKTDLFLNRISKTAAIFLCKKGNESELFLLKKKVYTLYYGAQILSTAKSIGKNFYCGGPSCVNKHTIIKDFVCFNGMYINGGGKVTIGNYFHSGIECMIITQSHDYDKGVLIPYGIEFERKEVIIEDYVWLGRRVTILPGTHIGEGAIVQAGAVVHGKIPPYAIVGGNPAQVFKYRDMKHFEELKSQGKVLSDELYCKYKFPSESLRNYIYYE